MNRVMLELVASVVNGEERVVDGAHGDLWVVHGGAHAIREGSYRTMTDDVRMRSFAKKISSHCPHTIHIFALVVFYSIVLYCTGQ